MVTIGSLASLTSIMMASMMHLRMMQLVSGTLYFTYNITRRPALVSAAYWNLVFFAINSIMLLRLFLETRPETFTEDELDIFERHFLNTGLSPRQFKRLLTAAHWRHVTRGEVLVRQGEEVKELTIVHRGTLSVLLNGSEVELLEGGDKNAVIGLKTFLMRLDEVRFQGKGAAILPQNSTNSSAPSSATLPLASLADPRTPSLSEPAAPLSVNPVKSVGGASAEVLPDKRTLDHSESAAGTTTSEERRAAAPEKEGEGEKDTLHPSHTSVVVAKDALLLVWPMDELVKRVKADPVNLGFPLVGGMARSLVARSRNQSLKQSLTSYEAVMKAVLADGEVRSEEKRFLRECRQKFNVSEEHHWSLVEQ